MKATESEIQKTLVTIQTPVWKTASVGIAEKRIVKPGVFVRIGYTGKDGNRVYPGTYWASEQALMESPRQMVKARNGFGIMLRVIKISDLELVEIVDAV